jgi:hypothetical protein
MQQEHFSRDTAEKSVFCFKQAVEEQSYLKYLIKAYTLINNVHHVLNKHLVLYWCPKSHFTLEKIHYLHHVTV